MVLDLFVSVVMLAHSCFLHSPMIDRRRWAPSPPFLSLFTVTPLTFYLDQFGISGAIYPFLVLLTAMNYGR
jgi:hypothetical protein